MRKQFVIAICLACAATSALAQARLGSSAVGTMGGNGAITDVGGSSFGTRPQPGTEPRAPGAIDPRTGAPAAAAAPASGAPATAESNDRAPAPSSTPVLDGAVWGGTPNRSPGPNQ